MTALTASSKYTARNGKEYGLITDQDIYNLGSSGNTYNQIVSLLNDNNVDMDGLRTDIYGGVNAGLTTEEVVGRSVGDKYYDGSAGSTAGPTQYFMDPKGNTALQAISLVNDYDKAVADKNQLAIDNYNKVYGSRQGILDYYKTATKPSDAQNSASTSTPSPAPDTTWSFQYGKASKPATNTQAKEQTYVPWDSEFGVNKNSTSNSWLNNAMQDAVGVGFADTSKGQQFEQVLNSADKKPANAAAGPDIFQTLINSY